MKSSTIVCAIAIASMGFGTIASAQGNNRRGGPEELPQAQQQSPRQGQQPRTEAPTAQRADPRYGPRADQHYGQRYEQPRGQRPDNRYGYGYGQRGERQQDMRGGYRADYRDGRHNDRPYYYNARGPEFRRGAVVVREFRGPQYVVNNYHQYRLSTPPRGHQWVQVGTDYVLIAIATGLIANIILNN